MMIILLSEFYLRRLKASLIAALVMSMAEPIRTNVINFKKLIRPEDSEKKSTNQ